MTVSVDRLRELLEYEPESGVFIRRVRVGRIAAGMRIETTNQLGYVPLMIDRKKYLAHRLAWLYVYGQWPDVCDHIDGDPSNNRIENLRSVTQAVNLQNQTAARSQSGYLGVHKKRGKWRARIGVAGSAKYLGTFSTPEQAYAAYVAAKRESHEGNTI